MGLRETFRLCNREGISIVRDTYILWVEREENRDRGWQGGLQKGGFEELLVLLHLQAKTHFFFSLTNLLRVGI